MSPHNRTALAGLLVLLALVAAAPAQAGAVIEFDGERSVRVNDPLVPAGAAAELGRLPRGIGLAAGVSRSAPRALASTARGRVAVKRALRRARARGQIRPAAQRRYGRIYLRARRTLRRLSGARRDQQAEVVATLEAIALRGTLAASRMPALFLVVRRNTEYWPRGTYPATSDRVRFRGSEILFQYYPGSGLQLQPLANFKEANQMHGACVKASDLPCRREGLRKLLDELIATGARRGRFTAWEYYFSFGGGDPPWMSGMAQATAIQAFARASELLDEPRYLAVARRGFGAFRTPPPVGVATTGPLGGTHYLQYSFAPRLFIINAFLQAVIGLYDYAQITGDPRARSLFERAEPTARAELLRNDTGDWSTYSFGGRESTREYHELLREFAASLCSRLRLQAYCQTAQRFADYTTEPARLRLLGPAEVRKGDTATVRFSLSKLSAVQVTITRDGNTALDRVETFRRGSGSFAWKVRAAGTYTVRVAAKELRTGRGLRTRVSRQVESLP